MTKNAKTPKGGFSTAEDQLFDIAGRCHVGTRRMNDEPLVQFAARLTLDIEGRIALLLLELDEIAHLDLAEDAEAAS